MTNDLPEVPAAPAKAVHRRSIIMDSYEGEPGHLTIVGRLTDQIPWAEPAQQRIHDMTLAITVHLPDLVITTADAGLTAFPHTECPLIAPAFAGLVGLSVRRGFTRELRQRLGGVSGCAHLGELARAMGPATVRTAGEYVGYGSRNSPSGAPAADAITLPLGTCHLWAADGIAQRKLAAGWRPGTIARPVPPIEYFRDTDRRGGSACRD
jgi:hypothetical protein